MRANKIKEIWRDNKCATLGWLSIAHGFPAEVMAAKAASTRCVDLSTARSR